MKCKIKIWIYPLAIMGMVLFFTSSCKKDKNSPLETGTVTDVEGNVYQTVKIGDQWWMAENLKTTKYNDGSAMPLVTDSASWAESSTPAYCWYDNNVDNKNTYGALYNWFTVNTGKLAPTGWHVPTDAEWTTLTNNLGGQLLGGGKMKSTGTIEAGTGLWYSPNTGATNESGLTAIPAGSRSNDGAFSYIGIYGYWWSSSEFESVASYAWFLQLQYGVSPVFRFPDYKNFGFSVRCVKS